MAKSTRDINNDPLLQPLTIKSVTFRNRIMSTSHACGLQKDGFPQDAYQAYHEEKARGGIALSMFGGSSNVAIDSPNIFNQLNVATDEIIPHLQRFSARMHDQGAALMCQITHLGRRGEPYAGDWLPTIAPSVVRETLHRSIPREMDHHDIERVVKAYAAAALRCKQGGLDGIETLAGGHLIGQFLSSKTNLRTDEFGGCLKNRLRFAIMVHQAIRKAVGDDFLVGIRWVVDGGPDDVLSPEESIEAAKILQSEGSIDFFNAIYGSMDTLRALSMENMPGMGTPIAPWVSAVGRFRKEMNVPVFHAARISDLASARHAVAEGHIDMAGMTRAHIAEPHLVRKLMGGEVDRIRPCVGAQHCQSQHRPKCLHNAVTGRELSLSHTISKTEVPKRAIVVGAGPAGLEAARVLAERGHSVSVYEAASRPGGQVVLAAKCGWRRDLVGIIDWRLAELDRLGVVINFDSYVEADSIVDVSPDIVVLATGGTPQTAFGKGAEHVIPTWDVISRHSPVAPKVLIWDGTGRHPAPMAAQAAAATGADIVFATIDSGLAQDLTYAETTRWKIEFAKQSLEIMSDRRLVAVNKSNNRLEAVLLNLLTQDTQTVVVDQVIVEMGTIPDNELFNSLREHSANDGVTDLDRLVASLPQARTGKGFELHRIGDAQTSRNIHAAIYDAYRLCHVA